jgi:hypothetical protein
MKHQLDLSCFVAYVDTLKPFQQPNQITRFPNMGPENEHMFQVMINFFLLNTTRDQREEREVTGR